MIRVLNTLLSLKNNGLQLKLYNDFENYQIIQPRKKYGTKEKLLKKKNRIE